MSTLSEQVNLLTDDEAGILTAILEEYQRAKLKHPKFPLDMIHAAAVVAEEAGELVQASLQAAYEGGELARCYEEAIQTGAMGIRFAVNMPKYLG